MQSDSETKKPGILIVEDINSNIDVLDYILKADYTVFIAKTGKSALKKAQSTPIDLILLDIILPDMTGFNVLTELKSTDSTLDIPVIFITGLNNVQNEEKSFALGAVDYITKPFHNSVLLARIKTHIKLARQIRALKKAGSVDELTSLPNRNAFERQLTKEWNRAIREKTSIGLLAIDVDRFGDYNQQFGAAQGDLLLQIFAKTISKTLKRPADFVTRVGADEFAVLLPNTDAIGIKSIAESIARRLEQAVIPDVNTDRMTTATACIGTAFAEPEPESSVEDFVALSQTRLSKAKQTGENSIRN